MCSGSLLLEVDCHTHLQARRQDLAAGGAKNQKGGHIFEIHYWMYVATGGPNGNGGH